MLSHIFIYDRCCVYLDRCLSTIGLMLCPLADVIAFFSNHRDLWADVIALILRLMLLPCGRWNSHWVNFDICLADVINI